tara:strand:- start:4037 stop:5380 length:1344 start_codon:yes stop_codon:yes gene_type:complete
LDAQVVNSPRLNNAISAQEFANLLAPIADLISKNDQFAVAVSGGADSMALCLLADQWAKSQGCQMVALTVDHGLRSEAAAETQTVAGWLAACGIEHHVLHWQGDKPASGIQAAAREARYQLMTDWCQTNNVSALMTAHHLEDQVETFLLRAERGSGVDGLACMAAETEVSGIKLLRPLLAVSKNRLRETLIASDQNWLEDPSNQNPAYRRTKMRKLVNALEQRGLDASRFGTLVDHFSDLRNSTGEIVSVFVDQVVQIFPEGYAVVQGDVFRQMPEPIIERILVRLTKVFGGKTYPPRRDRLLRAVMNLKKSEFPGFTLGGCRFTGKSNEIMICREMRGISSQQIGSGANLVWDNLFDIEISGTRGNDVLLAPLGKKGWAEILQKSPELKDISLPYPVRLTLPALFDLQGVFEVPHLNFRREGREINRLRIVRAEFLNISPIKNLSK